MSTASADAWVLLTADIRLIAVANDTVAIRHFGALMSTFLSDQEVKCGRIAQQN
jgi:hypothetical protein